MSKNYAVIYHMVNTDLNARFRPRHIEFLESMRLAGRIQTAWKFPDYRDGLVQGFVICKGSSKEEVYSWFEQDPVISSGARTFEVRDAEQGIFSS